MKHPTIRFQGRDFILIGSLEGGGPIATVEQYTAGEVSYAHLQDDGTVWRHQQQIGTVEEITVTGETDVHFGPQAYGNILAGLWGSDD